MATLGGSDMRSKRYLGLGLVMLVAVFFVFAGAGAAFAQTGTEGVGQVIDGPDSPVLGDPVGSDRSPHGGYSAITDYCLQCHNIHGGGGTPGVGENYALLRQDTISEVCNTCHSLGNAAAGATLDATNATRVDPGTGGIGTTIDGQTWTAPTPADIVDASWDPFNPNYVTFTVDPADTPPVAGSSVHISGVVSKTCDRNPIGGGDGACTHAYYLSHRYNVTGYNSAASGGSRVLASGTGNAVGTLTVSYPQGSTTGTFRVQWGPTGGTVNTSTPITLPASNLDVANAMCAAPVSCTVGTDVTVAASAVTSSGGISSVTYTITYGGFYANTPMNVAKMVSPTGTNEVQTLAFATAGSASEVQTVNLGGATSGTFKLVFNSGANTVTTAALAYNATALAVQSALAAACTGTCGGTATSPIGIVGNVGVAGAAGGPYTITFTGELADTDFPQMSSIDNTNGGTGIVHGSITDVDGTPGPYTLTFDPGLSPAQTTGRITWHANADIVSKRQAIQPALEALSSIGTIGGTTGTNVDVSGAYPNYTVTFKGNLGSLNVAQLTSTKLGPTPAAGTITHGTTTEGVAAPTATWSGTSSVGLTSKQFTVLWARSTSRVVPDPGVFCPTTGVGCEGLAGFDGGGLPIAGKSVNPQVTDSGGDYDPTAANHGTIWDPSPGTAATRTAYDVTSPLSEHAIGEESPPNSGGMPGPGDSLVQFTDFGSVPSTNTTSVIDSNGNWTNNNTRVDLTATTTHESEGVTPEGGLTCVSCHTPHGDFGQLINSRYVWNTVSGGGAVNLASTLRQGEQAGDGTTSGYALYKVQTGTTVNRMDLSAGGSVVSAGTTLGSGSGILVAPNTAGTYGGATTNADGSPKYAASSQQAYWQTCASGAGTVGSPWSGCVPWQMRDQAGQIVSTFGYKLLSAYPNHTYAVPGSWGAISANTDMQSWCGKCHPSRVNANMPVAWTQVPGYGNPDGQGGAATTGNAGTYHNHPTACTYCHGNPSYPAQNGDPATKDFPHTSQNTSLLKAYPDGLCITCHNNLP